MDAILKLQEKIMLEARGARFDPSTTPATPPPSTKAAAGATH